MIPALVDPRDRFPQHALPRPDDNAPEFGVARYLERQNLALLETLGTHARTINALVAWKPWTSVVEYGGKGDGTTDNTQAFQAAIDAQAEVGGGDVIVPPGRYLFAGVLTLPWNVSLCGTTSGPLCFDPTGLDVTTTSLAPILMPTVTGTAFITSTGGRVADLVFYYPNQVNCNTSPPISYAATIVAQPAKIYRCTFLNSYHAISISVGQSRVHDCFIGALYRGVYVDTAYDCTILQNIHMWPFYDYLGVTPGASPSTLGAWALSNSIGLDVRRVDSLIVDNMLVYQHRIGIQFANSPLALTPDHGYGHLSNIDLDTVQYGVVCYESNASAGGYKFTNLNVGEGSATGQIALYLPTGGATPPYVQVTSGSVRGAWAGGKYSTLYGTLRVSDFIGINDVGLVTAPAVPVSMGAATNTFPHPVRVFIAGGTVTANIALNGTNTQMGSPSSFLLLPGDTIAITYTVAPTWQWFSA